MKKTKTPRPDSMMEYLNTLTKTVKDRAQESLDDFRTRMAPILAKGDALVQICGGFAQAHQAQYEARRAALEDPTLRGGYPHLTPIVTAILAEIDGALALLSGVPVQVARLRRLVEGMKADGDFLKAELRVKDEVRMLTSLPEALERHRDKIDELDAKLRRISNPDAIAHVSPAVEPPAAPPTGDGGHVVSNFIPLSREA
jgi:hypothetical protein